MSKSYRKGYRFNSSKNNKPIGTLLNIDEVAATITEIADKYIVSEERKEAVQRFFDKYGERFFTAPASSNTNYHECYIGGLVTHTLRVIRYLLRLHKVLAPDLNIESIVTVGLFHDCGKIGSIHEDLYLPQTNDWKRNNGSLYELNQKLLAAHHSRWSICLLQDVGLKLTDDEFLAITYHDGQGLKENESICLKESDLVLLLQTADRWSVQFSVARRE